jgi:hypothetical protein
MKSILNKLYNGQLFPAEQAVRNDNRYMHSMQKQNEDFEALNQTFSSEQRNLFEKYRQCTNCLNAYLLQKAFRQGFRIGARILIEVERG